MLLAGSIAFWSIVAYIAFKPHTVRVPAMENVEIHRSRRNGVSSPVVTTVVARVKVEKTKAPALTGRPARARLTGQPEFPALPQGAHSMPGRIGALPLPPRF